MRAFQFILSRTRSLALISAALGLLAVVAAADPHADLLRAHEAFHAALLHADAAALDRLLGEHFTWTHTDGLVQSKFDLLENIREGKLRYAELRTDQEVFNEYANSAVVTGHSTRRYADAAAGFELRYTLAFVKSGREWKAAAYHTTIYSRGDARPLQVRLGYPEDAKLLILNADDLAIAHSEDAASFAALEQKLITSATVMVPCPWFTEVAAYAKAHPDADLGLHLTLTDSLETYRWGPVVPRDLVPSLTGPDGYFYASVEEFVKHARLDDVEREIRAQIERAKHMGLEPTHLDSHMHALYATPELFGVLLKVARDFKLPIRMARNEAGFQKLVPLVPAGFPFPDAIFSPEQDVAPDHWMEYYLNVVKDLKPGVAETFVHLARDDAETQAIFVNHPYWGAAWRQRDLDVVSSPEFRKVLEENHVTLVGWRAIKKLLQQ